MQGTVTGRGCDGGDSDRTGVRQGGTDWERKSAERRIGEQKRDREIKRNGWRAGDRERLGSREAEEIERPRLRRDQED